jgi:REP element-mobilizing transposase RayT
MKNLKYKRFYRRKLPHLQPPGATLFITFRLANSIPQKILVQFRREANQIDKILSEISDPQEHAQRTYSEQKRLFGIWDGPLDSSLRGPFWLSVPNVAAIVAESIHFRDGQVYDLAAYCIMPNHVHMVFTPLCNDTGDYYPMSAIMHSLKLYTARRCNALLEQSGRFWQHENYDHVVRDDRERRRIVNYVLNNPVKAGLVEHWKEWEWTYCKLVT